MRPRADALLVDVDTLARLADDTAVLAFVDEVRAAGRAVGLASGADDVPEQLTGRFDTVFTPADAGIHKPAPGYFAAVCVAVGTPPDRCLFVDDTDRNIRAARAAGLSAYRLSGTGDLPYLRAALGL